MGTDLYKTIHDIVHSIKYYIKCCKPKNEKEIKEKLDALIEVLNENR